MRSQAIAALALAVAWLICSAAAAQVQWVGQAHVIDGDTIEIGKTRIRFFGIDAPESYQTCLDFKGQTYQCGQQAKEHLKSLVGDYVVLCADLGKARVRIRRWGRCFANGVNLQAAMVGDGLAESFTAHSSEYVDAESTAKAQKLGIWQGRHTKPQVFRQCRRAVKTVKSCS